MAALWYVSTCVMRVLDSRSQVVERTLCVQVNTAVHFFLQLPIPTTLFLVKNAWFIFETTANTQKWHEGPANIFAPSRSETRSICYQRTRLPFPFLPLHFSSVSRALVYVVTPFVRRSASQKTLGGNRNQRPPPPFVDVLIKSSWRRQWQMGWLRWMGAIFQGCTSSYLILLEAERASERVFSFFVQKW